MEVFLGKACCTGSWGFILTMLTRMSGHAAGYELCHQVIGANEHCSRPLGLILGRSGITITASYAIKQSARLLKVRKLEILFSPFFLFFYF